MTGSPTRIVIAEDEAIIRMDLRELLEEVGYEVIADCGRGDEALRVIRQTRPDLAILDVKMPGRDGISVAAELAPERICPVILITAFSDPELVGTARDAGVMAYLVKPYQREDLVPAIEVALGRFSDLMQFAERSEVLAEQLEVKRLTDRAKAQLMRDHGLTEDDAFKFLQRTAMNQRRPLRDVAQAVLDGSLQP